VAKVLEVQIHVPGDERGARAGRPAPIWRLQEVPEPAGCARMPMRQDRWFGQVLVHEKWGIARLAVSCGSIRAGRFTCSLLTPCTDVPKGATPLALLFGYHEIAPVARGQVNGRIVALNYISAAALSRSKSSPAAAAARAAMVECPWVTSYSPLGTRYRLVQQQAPSRNVQELQVDVDR